MNYSSATSSPNKNERNALFRARAPLPNKTKEFHAVSKKLKTAVDSPSPTILTQTAVNCLVVVQEGEN
jgi:hypothetical protein